MRKEYFVKPEDITRPPTHPGLLFAEEILPALGRRTIGEIVKLLGVSRKTLRANPAQPPFSANSPPKVLKLAGKRSWNKPLPLKRLNPSVSLTRTLFVTHRLPNHIEQL